MNWNNPIIGNNPSGKSCQTTLSISALGISKTIIKVKLNQINQLNYPPLISDGVIPVSNQSHLIGDVAGSQLGFTWRGSPLPSFF